MQLDWTQGKHSPERQHAGEADPLASLASGPGLARSAIAPTSSLVIRPFNSSEIRMISVRNLFLTNAISALTAATCYPATASAYPCPPPFRPQYGSRSPGPTPPYQPLTNRRRAIHQALPDTQSWRPAETRELTRQSAITRSQSSAVARTVSVNGLKFQGTWNEAKGKPLNSRMTI
jgi:hypothetical protein